MKEKIKDVYTWFRMYLIVFLRCNHIQIKLPKSTIISHYAVGSVIPKGVEIGENCLIRQNLTIGTRYRYGKLKCIIGDNVEFGANVSILVKPNECLHIGNNVKIGAGSVILKDIDDNMTICGIWK